MYKFDINSAIKGQKVVTRGGTEVFNIFILTKCKDSHCVIGVTSHGTILTWTIEGIYGKDAEQIQRLRDLDLFLG